MKSCELCENNELIFLNSYQVFNIVSYLYFWVIITQLNCSFFDITRNALSIKYIF